MHENSRHLAHFQERFVEESLSIPLPARVLLSAPVGGGKGTALVEAVRRLVRRDAAARFLIVTSVRTLQQQWLARLRGAGMDDLVMMDAPRLRELETASSNALSPWAMRRGYVVASDFLKPTRRLEEALNAGWDLVILDEPNFNTKGTRRRQILDAFWSSPVVNRLIASTASLPVAAEGPDGYDRAGAEQLDLPPAPSNAHYVAFRWSLQMYGGIVAEPSRRRTTTVIHAELTDRETEFFVALRVKVNQASTPMREMKRAMLSRAESSLYAADQMLQRRIAQLSEPDFTAMEWDVGVREALVSNFELPLSQEQCRELLNLLEAVEADSRWERFESWFYELSDSKTSGLAVFTESEDTAVFLADKLRELGHAVAIIARDVEQPDLMVANVGVIVAQTSALRGVELPFLSNVLHYDPPLTPEALAVRYSRFPLWSFSRGAVQQHTFLLARPIETDEELSRLLSSVVEST